jgi:hypothetical protein
MWIFGQVWFACLVGFAAGVLLDWVVRVRPLTHQVADLESRARNSPHAESDDSMFHRGTYDAPGRFDSTGFGGDRSRGLLTPAEPASLATDLLEVDQRPTPSPDQPFSGVEDYPGVARLSGIWADDPEQTPEAQWGSSEPQADTPTTVTPLVPPPSSSQVPPPSEADQQYLEFLRSGGTTADRDAEGAFDDRDELVDEPRREAPAEVTSILPAVDGYGAYEGYAQDDFTSNGYQHNGYQGDYQDNGFSQPSSPGGYDHDGYQIVDYQQEDLTDPGESSMPLPHRDTSEHSPRRYAPFEIPFGQLDGSDAQYGSDVQSRAGDLTPIGDGGFQPFQKPGDDIGPDTDDLGEPSSWFDMSAAPPPPRSLPIGEPGATHPDLLGESVFGGEQDHGYQEDGAGRSLFEPVIAPDDTPPDYDAPLFDPTGGQGTTPRPIRVRTGVEATGPTPVIGNGHEPPAGPFGPGSALPLPDGRPPSPGFRVKARTSSMVFHTESSPFYERLEPQVWFRDQQDAERAGFTSWERPRSW